MDGRGRLLDAAVDLLRGAACDELVAVTRAPDHLGEVTVVVNPDPDRGMGSSLRLGLAAATGDIAVVTLVDTPGITAADVRAVVGAVRAGAAVAVADFRGDQRPPVAFARAIWPEVVAGSTDDQGARGFLRARPDLVVAVACSGDPTDIDTEADLARWREAHATNPAGISSRGAG